MSIENLMETIIREILTELGKTKKSNKILFLERDIENARMSFSKLIANWDGIEFLSDFEDKNICEYQCILVGDLSIDEFLNISEGKQINEKTNIMRKAFLRNKQVLVLSEGLEHRKYKDGSNENFYQLLEKKEELLNGFGLEFVGASDLNERLKSAREIEHFNREKVIEEEKKENLGSYKIDDKLVTLSVLKDIIANINTEEILVSGDTIITSLAKDYIRENNLNVKIES